MKRFYTRPDGSVWSVTDDVRTQEFVPSRTTAAGAPAAPKQ
jgi:hypothetical protein